MRSIVWYEAKKILQKKTNWAAFAILLALCVFLAIAGNIGKVYDEDDRFVETFAERNDRDRSVGLEASGKVIDDEAFYDARERKVAEGREVYDLSERERAYWDRKEKNLPEKFVYQYAEGYRDLVCMDGCYMVSMLLTFLFAIVLGGVFSDEGGCRTDALILCTRHGRGRLYAAKILAGSLVSMAACLIFSFIRIWGAFWCYGSEGFDAMYQVAVDAGYSYGLTVGGVVLIMLGILFLSSLLIGIFTMILAGLLRSGVGAMAIVVGGLFAARLLMPPDSWGLISRLWNCIPINVLYNFQGFRDLRLFSFGGISLTTWQFAPILYLILGAALITLGRYRYCRTQIGGR